METQAQNLVAAFSAAWQQVAAERLNTETAISFAEPQTLTAAALPETPVFKAANGTVFATSCFGDLAGAAFFCLSAADGEELVAAAPSVGGLEAILDEVFAAPELNATTFTPATKLEVIKSWPAVVGGPVWLAEGELTLGGQTRQALLLYAPQSSWPESAEAFPFTQQNTAPAQETLEEQKLKRLERLLDVELEVIVRFGLTQAPLRDIVRYGAGSLVELNRMVDEPVDILVNGRSLAQGEVVVIDGYYGVRITSISTPGERAMSLL